MKLEEVTIQKGVTRSNLKVKLINGIPGIIKKRSETYNKSRKRRYKKN